jgi:hypothetical protein
MPAQKRRKHKKGSASTTMLWLRRIILFINVFTVIRLRESSFVERA